MYRFVTEEDRAQYEALSRAIRVGTFCRLMPGLGSKPRGNPACSRRLMRKGTSAAG